MISSNLNHPLLYKQGAKPPQDFRIENKETKVEPPKLKMVDIQLNNEGADDSVPQFTPEKGITPNNQSIQQIETALRELLERQTQEAEIATEATGSGVCAWITQASIRHVPKTHTHSQALMA
ncbi:hypothetical protein PIB30_050559 [Stylosanthes scabra]|uniref:Uncharacterized protein n=1 Tax=Stylosanthes scabra TaxID=79078 RepID=A0ABU6QHW0_9FABA|nr:hypothetical protein [Stylosanthes scabra]